MNATLNHEGIGGDAAQHCLNSILRSANQAEACRALVEMLDSLSGDGHLAKQARRGAAVALVNVLERGLKAIASEGGQ